MPVKAPSAAGRIDPRTLAKSPAAFREALVLPGARGVVRFALAMVDFQRTDFTALDPALVAVRDGCEPPVTRYWIERTKGASKDTDIAISLLWLLFASPRMLTCQVAAADEDQADELRRAAKGIVRANPWLMKFVEVQEWRIVNRHTESTAEIIPADIAGSHGARPDVLVVNEISHIPDGKQEFVDNLLDNASKVPFGVVIIATNAGFRDGWQYKLREVARTTPERWYFSQYTEPAPWISPAELSERQRATSAARFNRLWRGIWCDDSGDALDQADIDAAVILSGPQPEADPEQAYVAGLDLGVKFDATGMVVLSVNPHKRRIEVASVDSWKARPGAEVNLLAVLETIRTVDGQFRPRWFVDPWQASLMIQLMRREGMRVEELPFSAPNLDKMASAVINTFTAHTIALYHDDQLLKDLKSFQLEDKGRSFRLIVPRNERGHADRGTALAICLPEAVRLLRRGEYATPSSMASPRDDPTSYGNLIHQGSQRYGLNLDLSNRGPERWERQYDMPMPGNIPIW